MSRCDAGVAQPVRDGAEIDAGFEQMDGRAVPQTMWMDAFAFKRRIFLGGAPRMTLEDEPGPETREEAATMVAEQRLRVVSINLNTQVRELLTNQTGGLRPKWTQAFFSPLAKESNAGRRPQIKVGRFQGYDFLHAGARVIRIEPHSRALPG